MRYQGRVYRPPSEADSWILQATLGCSWNNCTYCDMYRDKTYRERPLDELLAEIRHARTAIGPRLEKVFVADGDALGMPTATWLTLLQALRDAFPALRRVSCYATAANINAKSASELNRLRQAGLALLYVGPESGDETVLRQIAKGPRPAGAARDAASRDTAYLFEAHVNAAAVARAAGIPLSVIFLLGAGGVARSEAHARGSARLATAMDPAFLSALTLTVVPGTPLARTQQTRGWVLPDVDGLLRELRILLAESRLTNAVFRTNHASNYLPLAGQLPRDQARLVQILDAALRGDVPLRPEHVRGL